MAQAPSVIVGSFIQSSAPGAAHFSCVVWGGSQNDETDPLTHLGMPLATPYTDGEAASGIWPQVTPDERDATETTEEEKRHDKLLQLGYDTHSGMFIAPGFALAEMLLHILFLAIFSAVVFGPRNTDSYELHRYFQNNLFEKEYVFGENFWTVSSQSEAFEWIERVLLPTMYPTTNYNDVSLDEEALGFTLGGVNRRLGAIRLRQLRVRENTCSVPAVLASVITDCYGSYSDVKEFKGSFVPVDSATAAFPVLADKYLPFFTPPPFAWRSAAELEEHMGWLGPSKNLYAGSGFIQDLPSDHGAAVEIVRWLRESRWLDRASRALFVDFNVYNAGVDYISQGRVIFEMLPTGGILPSYRLRPVPLLTSIRVLDGEPVDSLAKQILYLEMAMYIWVVFMIIREMKICWLLRMKYFADFWNCFEIINLACFVCTALLRLYVLKLTRDNEEAIGDANGPYVNLFLVFYYAELIDNVSSFNAIITFFKIFKYLRHHKKLGQFTDTLSLAAGQMLYLCIIIFIIIIGYGISFHVAFGAALEHYRDLPESIFTLFLATLGDFDLVSLRSTNPYLGPFLFVSFIVIMFFVIVSMFLSIVDEAYEKVRHRAMVEEFSPLLRDLALYRARFSGWLSRGLASASKNIMPELSSAASAIADAASATVGEILEAAKNRAAPRPASPHRHLQGSRGGSNADSAPKELSEMTVAMKEQELLVLQRISQMEVQQHELRELIKQLHDGIIMAHDGSD